MMSLADVKTMLDTTGLDVAYDHFDISNAPTMPFITYNQPASNNFEADGVTYAEVMHIYINLWTDKRDEAAEALLKNVLESNDIPWSRNETYYDKEQCYEITYEVEV